MISKHNINMSVKSDKKLFSSKARVSEKHESPQPGRSVVLLEGIFFYPLRWHYVFDLKAIYVVHCLD